jgi:hypothetical protein
MSHTQSTTLTAVSNTKYRTFDNEAEYESWPAQFNAQNADGQRVIDFRVRRIDHAHSTSIHLTSCRTTDPQIPWSSTAH